MKKALCAGAVTALLVAAAAPASAAPPAQVTVRVEGGAQTLLPATRTPLPAGPVNKDGTAGHECPGSSAIGALEAATAGDWGGPWNYGSQTVETIRGETHAFDSTAAQNHYWTFWLNYRFSNVGACDAKVQQGDDVLFFVGCYAADRSCSEPAPLRLEAPARGAPGEPVSIHVEGYSVTFDAGYSGSTSHAPAQGATVDAGGRTLTTDAAGNASFVPGGPGPVAMRATKPGFVRSATETVCVTDGHDGHCGTAAPGSQQPPPSRPFCASNGHDGLCGTRDGTPPVTRIAGIADGARFTRANAPRTLAGVTAPDPSGLEQVKLALTRTHGGHCSRWSPRSERFRPARCGDHTPFGIGDRAQWSYLLPRVLAPGRYVLDAFALDRALNREALARGRNRVVFEVFG